MISLIIAYYKNLPALELILLALGKQSEKNFEVIIAEDANDEATLQFLHSWKKNCFFTVKHVSHPDEGFRKTRILNKALEISKGDFMLFIDGDCIPHRHFIRTYLRAQKEGFALFGRRVMLGEKISEKLLLGKNISALNPLQLISRAKKIKYSLYLPFIKQEREEGIWGCNWGIAKKELIAVNGFDENYVHAGIGEDVDIEWRLKQNGIKLLSIRFGAIVYHLHHKEHYNEVDVQKGYALLNKKKEIKNN